MNGALTVLSAVAVGRAKRAAREFTIGAAIMVVATMLALGALVCAAGVLWLALRPELGAMGAWAVLGGCLFGLSLLLVAGYAIWRRQSRRTASLMAPPLPDLGAVIRRNEWPLIAVGLLVGFLSGLRRR